MYKEQRVCFTCGADISSRRIDAQFCKEACRKYYSRHGTRIGAAKPLHAPSPQGLSVPAIPPRPDNSGLVRTNAPAPTTRVQRVRHGAATFSDAFMDTFRNEGSFLTAAAVGALSATGDLAAEWARHKIVQAPALQAKAASAGRSAPQAPSPPVAKQKRMPLIPGSPIAVASPIVITAAPEKPVQKPLTIRTGDEVLDSEGGDALALPEAWCSFLGSVTSPFKMLVWGLPGSGKSTFGLRLLSALNNITETTYVSAEEAPGSETLRRRVERVLENPARTAIIARMPESSEEWYQVLVSPTGARTVMLVDSISVLPITPRHLSEAADEIKRVARERKEEGLAQVLPLFLLEHAMSVIWICQAQKDGRAYLGSPSWAHDADIVVQCEDGIARTTKNRFYPSGQEYPIHAG